MISSESLLGRLCTVSANSNDFAWEVIAVYYTSAGIRCSLISDEGFTLDRMFVDLYFEPPDYHKRRIRK